MRVLHVISSIALEHGGPSHAVRVMAQAVRELGPEVHVATTSYGTPEGREDPRRLWQFEENGVEFQLFPQIDASRWHLSFGLMRWLFAHVRTYDVVHVHSPFASSTWPACIAARRSGVPYVYRTLGTLDPWSLRQKSWKKRPYYHLVERRNLLGAYRVHVTSTAEREAIEALGVPRARIALIPIGIRIPPERARPRLEGPLRLLFIGRLHPKKGIPLLLEAVATLRAAGEQVTLQLAGSGDEAYTAWLRSETERLALRDSVQFVGFATGREKARLFAEAHVFVLPSYDENFGISVAEAMSYGLPVVVSDSVAMAERVRAAGSGRVCRTGDISSLVDAIRALASPDAQRDTGRRGVELVAAELSIPAMAHSLAAAYRGAEALKAHAAKRSPR